MMPVARSSRDELTASRRSAWGLAREIGSTLAAYVLGQILVSLILTALYAAGFVLVGLPFWYVLAPLCGFLNLVPHFGPVIGLATGIIVALMGGFSIGRTAEVVGVYAFAFALEGYVLTPLILGRRLHLRPLYVLLAVLGGGAMFGFLGLLFAVPVLAAATAGYRYFQERPHPPHADSRGG